MKLAAIAWALGCSFLLALVAQESRRPVDTDGDGLLDDLEDLNENGQFDPLGSDGLEETLDDETDWLDADTDDDGLSDGFESGMIAREKQPFFWSSPDPMNPDSDGDGLPDGLELGMTNPVSGMVSRGFGIKGTDSAKEFTYKMPGTGEIRSRKCWISDQDPQSITDPGRSDTNHDGILDMIQDPNGNGRADSGETDAAAGYLSLSEFGVDAPESLYTDPYRFRPRMLDGVIDPDGHNSDIFQIAFQSPLQDDEGPSVHVSNTECISVDSVERFASRIWIINLKWLAAASDPVEVWIESDSPYMLNGRTRSILLLLEDPLELQE